MSGGSWAGAAETVIDSWGKKEPGELCRFIITAHGLNDAFIVVHGAFGWDELISEPMKDNDFASVIAESGEVRVVSAVDGAVLFDGLFPEELESGWG